MILPDRRNTDLRSAGLLILGMLGWLPSAGAGEFPRTFRGLRENFDQYLVAPHGAFVFSLFTDGLSHLDRVKGLRLAHKVTRYKRRYRPDVPPVPDWYLLEQGARRYRVHTAEMRSRKEAIESLLLELSGVPEHPRLEFAIKDPILDPIYPEPPRWFLGMEWKGKPIGQFSFGKRFGGWEGHAVYAVTFLRGNLLITVEGRPQRDVETPLDPDPREIALKLDRYYTADPLEDLPADETQQRKTLEISVDAQKPIVSGQEYAVHFPLTSAGQAPVEIRLRVTGGEVWEVPRESAGPRRPGEWVPVEERDYFVRFSETGAQTLTCYHINAEGQCTAWGVLEVNVSEP